MGDLSPHFSRSEFIDRHAGVSGPIDSALVEVLERIRTGIGRPLPVLSGFRTEATNRLVGGARHSQHLVGRAADLPSGLVTVDQARSAGAVGIGVCRGWVVHVDVRRTPGPVIFRDCKRPPST